MQTMATTDTLFLITAFLSKCCVLGMLSRLTPQRIHHFILYAIFGLSICWVLSSVLIILVNCELNKPWARPIDHCTGLVINPLAPYSYSYTDHTSPVPKMGIHRCNGQHH